MNPNTQEEIDAQMMGLFASDPTSPENESFDGYDSDNADVMDEDEETEEEDLEEGELEEGELEEGEIKEDEMEEGETEEEMGDDEENTRSEDGDLVELIVGEKTKHHFFLSQHRLIRESRFFRSAFAGGYKEAQEKKFILEHEDPIIFEPTMFYFFEHWLNYGRFPDSEKDSDENLTGDGESEKGPFYETLPDEDNLVDLYLLADKYDVKRLRNACIESLLRNLNEVIGSNLPGDEYILKAFEYLPVKSPLCRLLAAAQCKWGTDEASIWKTDNMDFLRAVCCRFMRSFPPRGLLGRDFELRFWQFRED